jgi:hypothetical protein
MGLGCVKTRRRATAIEWTFFEIAFGCAKIRQRIQYRSIREKLFSSLLSFLRFYTASANNGLTHRSKKFIRSRRRGARAAGPALADDVVVVHLDAKSMGDLDNPLRHFNIGARRRWIASGVVMHESIASRIALNTQ